MLTMLFRFCVSDPGNRREVCRERDKDQNFEVNDSSLLVDDTNAVSAAGSILELSAD